MSPGLLTKSVHVSVSWAAPKVSQSRFDLWNGSFLELPKSRNYFKIPRSAGAKGGEATSLPIFFWKHGL